MDLLDKPFEEEPSQIPEPAKPPRNDLNLVRLFDKFGHDWYITKDQWRSTVLPDLLSTNNENPEQLPLIIRAALQEGLFIEVLDAAERLYLLDPADVQSTCMYGIALMRTHQLDKAEGIFNSFLQRYGEDGTVLTNLAKVYAAQNETKKTAATLWRALEVDPNVENGLVYYVALQRERNGPEGELDTLKRIGAIPGSWRAQFWLARKALEAQHLELAMAYYRESLSRVGPGIPDDLLLQMSGDLGRHGHLLEMLELTEPLFVPAMHGIGVGDNLIWGNLALGRIDRASRVLEQLSALKRPDWKEALELLGTEIAKAAL